MSHQALQDLKSLQKIQELTQSGVDEEKIVDHLEQRVLTLLEDNPELLFSWMYRLDVSEAKLQAAIKSPKGVVLSRALAELIWQRQKQRLHTRQQYRDNNPTEDKQF